LRKLIVSLLFLFLSGFIGQAEAAPQFKTGSVLLDDETDDAFQQWIRKIFGVAGLKQYEPRIYIIVNPEVNAAASVGGHIFIYSEFLMKCDNAEEFLGVMAHEVGHIAGGHISRIDAAQNQAIVPATAAVVLGGALALASGSTAPLEAALAGGAHVFERGMLKFSRTQESSADQAALTYLQKLRWPAKGLSEFLDKINKMYGSSARVDPYTMTHPLTFDRIQSIHEYVGKHSDNGRSIPHDIEFKFQRIKAKMMAFLDPSRALKVYKDSSLPSQYARAIAQYRLGKFDEALRQINALLNEHPKDPYFHELKGQVLFETGKVEEAIPALQSASSLKPGPLIKIMLAHALIERKSSCGSSEAIKILVPLVQKHPQKYPMAWRLLATAYGKTNRVGEAALALAEEAFLQENYRVATSQANRAKALLKSNPKSLMRVEDLLSQIKQKSGGVLGLD
jgi:predicted Zn-dependent protease